MDNHAQQLVRLAELLNVSAGVLKDLMLVRDFDGETGNLNEIIEDLGDLADRVRRIGFSGVPKP